MAKKTEERRRRRPAQSAEDREQMMIELAVNCAEQQLRDGTASAQVITHYLKLATEKERLERDILMKQRELITAKTESLQYAKKLDAMNSEIIAAMKLYSGKDENYDPYV